MELRRRRRCFWSPHSLRSSVEKLNRESSNKVDSSSSKCLHELLITCHAWSPNLSIHSYKSSQDQWERLHVLEKTKPCCTLCPMESQRYWKPQKQLIIYKIINRRRRSNLKQLVSCFSVTYRGTVREGLHISRYGIGQLVSGQHPARDGPAVYRQKTNPQRFRTGRDGRAQLPSLRRTT
ncbi:unnamed protein product [Brassica oleracea]